VLIFVGAGLLAVSAVAAEPLFRDPGAPIEQRVDDLLRRLTLEEKVRLLQCELQPARPASGAPPQGSPPSPLEIQRPKTKRERI